MSARESEGRLWDPQAELGGEHDELLAELEQLLDPLRASAPPALELPVREASADEPASSSRGWLVALVSLAAALALWLAWRAQPEPPSGSRIVQAPRSAPPPILAPASAPLEWRVEALDGDNHCQPAEVQAEGGQAPPELDVGSTLEHGASLQLGEQSSARLSSGGAQLELHPSSLVHNEQGVLHLSEGRAWVDLPSRATEARWRIVAEPLSIETRAARFMVSVEPGRKIEIEVVSGELELVGDEEVRRARAGQLCRARVGPAPLESLDSVVCENP